MIRKTKTLFINIEEILKPHWLLLMDLKSISFLNQTKMHPRRRRQNKKKKQKSKERRMFIWPQLLNISLIDLPILHNWNLENHYMSLIDHWRVMKLLMINVDQCGLMTEWLVLLLKVKLKFGLTKILQTITLLTQEKSYHQLWKMELPFYKVKTNYQLQVLMKLILLRMSSML